MNSEPSMAASQVDPLVRRLFDFHSRKMPCCHFGEFDELIVSGTVTSCRPPVVVRDMHVTAATVYPLHDEIDSSDCEAEQRLMMFKCWCDDKDPQLPPDGDTRLWFDFSAPDTSVAVVVKRSE